LCHKTFCGNADIRCIAVVVEAVNRETRLSIESNADPLQSEIGKDVVFFSGRSTLCECRAYTSNFADFFWIYRHREKSLRGGTVLGPWISNQLFQLGGEGLAELGALERIGHVGEQEAEL
jgi:hypothetical protein